MKKKTIALLAGAAVLLLAALFAGQAKKPQTPSYEEQAYEMLDRVNNAITSLNEDWKRQIVTKVVSITYRSREDDSTIIQHICQSAYDEADPEEIEGVNLLALAAIQELQPVENGRPCKVNQLDALLFEKETRSYLCFTISPECTIVFEYSPDKVEEREIFEIAESIPSTQESYSWSAEDHETKD